MVDVSADGSGSALERRLGYQADLRDHAATRAWVGHLTDSLGQADR